MINRVVIKFGKQIDTKTQNPKTLEVFIVNLNELQYWQQIALEIRKHYTNTQSSNLKEYVQWHDLVLINQNYYAPYDYKIGLEDKFGITISDYVYDLVIKEKDENGNEVEKNIQVNPHYSYEPIFVAYTGIEPKGNNNSTGYDLKVNFDFIKSQDKDNYEFHTETITSVNDKGEDEVKIIEKLIFKAHSRLFIPIELITQPFELNIGMDIRPRSGLSKKHGIFCSLGTIDNDYRGYYGVILYNSSDEHYFISNDDAIAQVTFYEKKHVTFIKTDKLNETIRGDKGFGHTDQIQKDS